MRRTRVTEMPELQVAVEGLPSAMADYAPKDRRTAWTGPSAGVIRSRAIDPAWQPGNGVADRRPGKS